MSKRADARREASLPGGPNAYPANGSLIPTAPKHRVTHPKSASRLRPFTDYIPAPENRLPGQHWSKAPDRDWNGKNVGCYHLTAHNGKSVLCEGLQCRFAPNQNTGRSPRSDSAQQARSDRSAVRNYLRRLGYSGPVTPLVRTLVLDAIVFDAQCSAMAS